MRPTSEKDEFLLNRLLDGDLTQQQAEQLRQRIQKEPALREAYQAYVRINSSLEQRKQDRPTVDWLRFHNAIMQSIKDQPARHKTISISKWLMVGAPLAAAAAIALLITFYQGPTTVSPNGKDSSNTHVVVGIPHESKADKIVIRYNRPTRLSEKRATGAIKVKYGRSTEMAEAVREVDETGHSGWGFGAVKAGAPVPAGESMDVPPL
ncbi:MAG: anti-sigma factor family protein [Planctomycetota bacterium]|jgi:negative regulator of sigma E activity